MEEVRVNSREQAVAAGENGPAAEKKTERRNAIFGLVYEMLSSDLAWSSHLLALSHDHPAAEWEETRKEILNSPLSCVLIFGDERTLPQGAVDKDYDLSDPKDRFAIRMGAIPFPWELIDVLIDKEEIPLEQIQEIFQKNSDSDEIFLQLCEFLSPEEEYPSSPRFVELGASSASSPSIAGYKRAIEWKRLMLGALNGQPAKGGFEEVCRRQFDFTGRSIKQALGKELEISYLDLMESRNNEEKRKKLAQRGFFRINVLNQVKIRMQEINAKLKRIESEIKEVDDIVIVGMPSATEEALFSLLFAGTSVAFEEAGAATAFGLKGCHTTEIAWDGASLEKGKPLAGIVGGDGEGQGYWPVGSQNSESEMRIREPVIIRVRGEREGRPEFIATQDVEKALFDLSKIPDYPKSIALHIPCQTKTGLSPMSFERAIELRREYKAKGIEITIFADNAQMGLTEREIRYLIRNDVIVVITGSKKIGGYPFSCRALMNERVADRLREIIRAHSFHLPPGFSHYFTQMDFADLLKEENEWKKLNLPASPNFITSIKWATAIDAMWGYFAIPEDDRRFLSTSLRSLTIALLKTYERNGLFLIDDPEPSSRTLAGERKNLGFCPFDTDIITLRPRRKEGQKTVLFDVDALHWLMNTDLSALGREEFLQANFHLGKPHEGTIRIRPGARFFLEFFSFLLNSDRETFGQIIYPGSSKEGLSDWDSYKSSQPLRIILLINYFLRKQRGAQESPSLYYNGERLMRIPGFEEKWFSFWAKTIRRAIFKMSWILNNWEECEVFYQNNRPKKRSDNA